MKFFFVRHHFRNGIFILPMQPGNLRVRFFLSVSIISGILTFSLIERTSWLLLGLEALPASLLLRFGAIITVNKGFLNTDTAITRHLMWTARMLEEKWRQVLRGSMGMGTKEDESSTGHVWAAGFYHVTAHSRLAHVLKLRNRLFFKFPILFFRPW
jgi:hypothetical protein